MPKILLVEDDNNLREIFEMRLQAEGYKTVSAGDGEAALDIAVKEKPDLIIADIMMPKLSGFEMLETLRAAPEMANVKVIMMTALGQAEDMARGEKLGVVKYLVKSQVTLEDFVRVVREVLPPSPDAAEPKATNNQGGSMQDDNPTPSSPADNSGMGTNPAGGASDAAAGSGAMSTEEEKDKMDQKVDDAMGGGASTGGDMGGGSMGSGGSMPGGSGGGDASGTSTTGGGDMPTTSPPMGDDKGEGDKDMNNPTGPTGTSGGSM
jgi:CheY-like chemotaxis protein